jgi:protein SCO1/2
MRLTQQPRWIWSLLTALLLVSAASVQAQPEAQVLQRIGYEQNLDTQLPMDVPFTRHDGETVTFRDLFQGRPVIVAPIYYNCPMLCGLIVNGLLDSIKQITFNPGVEYDIVVFSFDPREGADLAEGNRNVFLEQYGREGVGDGIHFLVGEDSSITQMTAALGFQYEWVPELNDFAHASGVVVATPEGRISRYFYGIMYPPRDVRLGLVEASENKIGSPVDQLLLFCYHYDPTTGKYGLVIHRVVNTAAVLTAVILGTFLTVMLRREKRHMRISG